MEHVAYNTRVVSFPDGSKRLHKSDKTYHRMSDEERQILADWKKNFPKDWCDYSGYIQQVGSIAYWWENYCKMVHDGHSVERGKLQNAKRAVQKVYDLARSNEFDYFFTFTFNPDKVDSYDYDAVCAALGLWLDRMRKKGVKWLVVPEKHPTSGRWHFHALVKGKGILDLIPAFNPYDGSPLYDKSGNRIYNAGNYEWGFTEATEIRDPQRCATYISQYITECFDVPAGKKRYWASRSLNRPVESLTTMTDQEFGSKTHSWDYFRDLSNGYGRFQLAYLGQNLNEGDNNESISN